MVLRYQKGTRGQVGLVIAPAGAPVPPVPSGDVDSLVQLSWDTAAASGGFAAGHTMRGGAAVDALVYAGQEVTQTPEAVTIHTRWTVQNGLVVRHRIEFSSGRALCSVTEVENQGPQPVTLELLSSFAFMIPVVNPDASDRFLVHRLRSVWSAEGRLVTETAEDLQLEPSWSGHGVRVERFGQVGSLPVRKWFPWAAVESRDTGITWAAQVGCPSSWQIELYRRTSPLCVSGGLADFESGHWQKVLAPGERLVTPRSWVTVVKGGVEAACRRLVDVQRAAFGQIRTRPLGPQFNEFCASWGEPSHAKILTMIDAVKDRGLETFVIDAGWYADPVYGWERSHGDWVVSGALFPEGLEPVVAAIVGAGMIPGIWFELETCGEHSRLYTRTEFLLARNGVPITSGHRRFLDLANPRVIAYLTERVIGMIQRYGFRYLKVDYNESVGVGCDGEGSLGEALRQKLLATQDFFKTLRAAVPGLVIELCASGGHRLEPSMLALADVASFSDAHECPEIPLIAANLHRVLVPAQSLIWAVLRKTDSPQRLAYSLASTFLGVPCLSGDVNDLTSGQWAVVQDALRFYRQLQGLILDGSTTIWGTPNSRYRKPMGWQGVWREGASGQEALAVVHQFGGASAASPSWFIGPGWTIADRFGVAGDVTIRHQTLVFTLGTGPAAAAVFLTRPSP